MGYAGKLEEKLRAQELRKKGLSYREILLEISVSKSTISQWCKDIALNKKQISRLTKMKFLGQHKGSIIAANNKRKARIQRTKLILKEAKKELGKLNKRDKFITGIALYAGEGNKSDRQTGFANADPRLIKFMTRWFKEFCQIPNEKFRGALWIHEGSNIQEAKQYWSKLTGIPLNQFQKVYIAENKTKSKKIRKHIHKYGVFSIRFHNSVKQRRILGWISALLGGKIARTLIFPGSSAAERRAVLAASRGNSRVKSG